jgi:hypothetical protein
MFEGFADGPDPSQRVVLARGGAVDQIIRITPSAFHAGTVADIALLPANGQLDLPDIWDRLGTLPAVQIGPTALEKLAQQASAFKPWTKVQVRKGEKEEWETVTLISATCGVPAVRWAISWLGGIELETFSAANAAEAEGWQIRAAPVRPPLFTTPLEKYLMGCMCILLLVVIIIIKVGNPPENAHH